MERSAIILAGGMSKEFDGDKAVLELEGKPLLSYVVESVKGIAEEVIVVTDSQGYC